MKSEIIAKIQENTTLTCKLKVANQMAFIDLLTQMGYRANVMWDEKEEEQFNKLMELANAHTEHQMKTIHDHIKAKF